MKNRFAPLVLIILGTLLVLAACQSEQVVVEGTVEAINETSIEVTITSVEKGEFAEGNSPLIFNIADAKGADVEDLAIGDKVEIGFDGVVALSEPEQATAKTVKKK